MRRTPPSSSPEARTHGKSLAFVVVAVVVASSLLALGTETPPSTLDCQNLLRPPPPATTPLHHLFFLIKENHAFENYFATFPGVIGNPAVGRFPISYTSSQTIPPFPLNVSFTQDLPHDHLSDTAAVDGGSMDHFVAQAAADGYPDPSAAVGFYTARQIPQYFAYAQNYTLGDQFFTGVLGPTVPNRLFDLAGTSDGWVSDQRPPPGAIDVPTILDQLTQAGIRWAYDYSGVETNLTPLNFPSLAGQACARAQIQPMANLSGQLTSSDAPAVTFLDPSHDPLYSEHPPQNVTMGAQWTAAVVNAILASPVGSSSAVFILYDENGGYWDPVPPPTVGALGDGLRVPLLVISPWTPAHEVNHERLDPASLLRFVDEDFGLPYLSLRVANASPLVGFFNFTQPPRPPLLVPTPLTLTEVAGGLPTTGPAIGVPGDLPTVPAGGVLPSTGPIAVCMDTPGTALHHRRSLPRGERHQARGR